MPKCSQCGRSVCQAPALNAKALKLKFPEHMREAVTKAQNECDAFVRAAKKSN